MSGRSLLLYVHILLFQCHSLAPFRHLMMIFKLVIICILLLKLVAEGQQRHFDLDLVLIIDRIKHKFADFLPINILIRNFIGVPLRKAVLKEGL